MCQNMYNFHVTNSKFTYCIT